MNSIFQIIILSAEPATLSNVKGNIVPTQMIEGEKFPTELANKGWFFDPEEGERIQGTYFFGKDTSVDGADLIFSLGEDESTQPIETTFDESIIILAIIIIGGIAAAVFFLKGYKK